MSTPAPSVRLPSFQRILRYDVALVPDLVAFTFQGSVRVALELSAQTQTVTLHTLDCAFPLNDLGKPRVSICARGSVAPIHCESLAVDAKAQSAAFDFGLALAPGHYTLDILYTGELNDKLAGFYRSAYKGADGATKHMAVTQFEATDARRALPCVDEPAAKAVFDVTLYVAPHLQSVSNMPVLSRDTTRDSKEDSVDVTRGLVYPAGLVRYRYYPSPVMSTYLLAFVIGEFDYISEMSKGGTEVRVYTGLGKTHLGRFSLDTAVKALDFYNDYMGTPYPLAKMDLLAIPDFAAGAMENWGCITYRETALLIDPANSSAAVMQRVARTVCHEIAHMWFGNLVTMEWWTFLWLNEGFARFMEHLAVDHIYPAWHIWQSFVAEVYAQAQALDALESSHPVEVTVNHPDEVNEIFDSISYAKGASLIRMLNAAIGDAAFQKGLQAYLKKFAYQNTLSSDLWAAFSESSGTDVAKMMATWCGKVGYPVVSVSEVEGHPQKVCLCQERFLATWKKEDEAKLKEVVWTIPIQAATYNPANAAAEPHVTKILFAESKAHCALLGPKDGVLKLNPEQTAFYRTQYSPALFAKLAPIIPSLPPVERLGLLRDTFALSSSGRASFKDALDIVKYFEREENYAVVSALAGNLSLLASLHSDADYYPAIQALVSKTFAHAAGKLGWQAPAGTKEDALNALFRATVLSMVGSVGEQKEVIDEALARFRRFAAAPNDAAATLPADLRSVVYSIVAKKGTDADHAALLQMYRTSELQEEKNRVLSVLGLVDSKAANAGQRIKDALEFMLSDEVRPGNVGYAMSGVGSSDLGRRLAWTWFQEKFPIIQERLCKGQNFIIAGLLNGMLGGWKSTSILSEMQTFFAKHPIPQATRVLLQLTEAISTKAGRLERESADVKAWLAQA